MQAVGEKQPDAVILSQVRGEVKKQNGHIPKILVFCLSQGGAITAIRKRAGFPAGLAGEEGTGTGAGGVNYALGGKTSFKNTVLIFPTARGMERSFVKNSVASDAKAEAS